jgi:hypothetical protein
VAGGTAGLVVKKSAAARRSLVRDSILTYACVSFTFSDRRKCSKFTLVVGSS